MEKDTPNAADRLREPVKLSSANGEARLPARLSLPHVDDLIRQLVIAGLGAPSEQVIAKALLANPHSAVPPAHSEVSSSTPIKSASDIGRLVREERLKRNLSQSAFAELAGVGRRFLSELENGKASLEIDRVLHVAAVAGLDVIVSRT